MGLDISIYVERIKGNQWVSADYFTLEDGEYVLQHIFTGRDRELFIALGCDLWLTCPLPVISPSKGLPRDVSEFVKNQLFEGAFHESYLTLAELIRYYNRYDEAPRSLKKIIKKLKLRIQDIYNDDLNHEMDIRIVFWFDN